MCGEWGGDGKDFPLSGLDYALSHNFDLIQLWVHSIHGHVNGENSCN